MSYNGLEQVGVLAIQDIGMVSFINNRTKEEEAYINFAQKFDFSLTGDTTSAKGRGRSMVTFDLPKQGEGSFELELTSLELMSFSNGSKVQTSAVNFYNRDEFVVNSPDEVVTLSDTPIADSIRFYKVQSDKRTKIGELESAEYTTGKSATLTGAVKGDIIVATYFTTKQAQNFTIKVVNELSESYTMVFRCKGKTKQENAFVDMQLTFPNVTVASDNDFGFDPENPSTFGLKVNILGDNLDDMVQVALVPDIV